MHHFLILGGDPRQRYLSRMLEQAGQNVTSYYDASPSFSLQQAMEDSDIILCPVPFTRDGQMVYSANHLKGLDIHGFLNHLQAGHTLFGGNIPPLVEQHCKANSIPYFDFMKMEAVACKNAIATAEGSIAEAISLSPKNLHKSHCLVLGWGRCAQALADKLRGLNASVTVCGRSKEKLAAASYLNCSTLLLAELEPVTDRFDFIFNTIPAMVLGASAIQNIRPETVIIDLATSPGGVDFDACNHCNIRAKLCPGLPGIYSPMSSAEILYEAVTKTLQERNL